MNAEFTAADLRRILRVSESGLRSCLRAALLPVLPRSPGLHSFQHLVLLRTAQGLKEEGVSVRRTRTVLLSLQRQLGEGQGMLSLKMYASGKRVVVWDGLSHWQPDSGQFLPNFDTKQILQPARLKAPRPHRSRTVWRGLNELWHSRQSRVMKHGAPIRRPSDASRLLWGPISTWVCSIHNVGELKEAETCIRRALKFGPESALAHFNLAVMLEDRADKSGALTAYAKALKRAPDFREALFEKPIVIWHNCMNSSVVDLMPSVIMTLRNAWDVPREASKKKQPFVVHENAPAYPLPPLLANCAIFHQPLTIVDHSARC